MESSLGEKNVISKGSQNQLSSSYEKSMRASSQRKQRRSQGGNESRDDGDQSLLRKSKRGYSKSERNIKSKGPGIPRASLSSSRGRPPTSRHRKNAESLDSAHLELLRAERNRLTKRLKDLEAQFESTQKKKAYEKSTFLMKRGQLLVEIEGLRDDKNFLLKKRDRLSDKLLDEHLKRLHLLELEERKETESRKLEQEEEKKDEERKKEEASASQVTET